MDIISQQEAKYKDISVKTAIIISTNFCLVDQNNNDF